VAAASALDTRDRIQALGFATFARLTQCPNESDENQAFFTGKVAEPAPT